MHVTLFDFLWCTTNKTEFITKMDRILLSPDQFTYFFAIAELSLVCQLTAVQARLEMGWKHMLGLKMRMKWRGFVERGGDGSNTD